MMSSKPRLLVPYGLKTLLEGLSRAVLRIQPASIAQFASMYFTELLQFRECHPCIDIKDLVKEFQHAKVDTWPEENSGCETQQVVYTENVLQDAGVCPTVQDIPPEDTCHIDETANRQLSAEDEACPEVKEELTCNTEQMIPEADENLKCAEDVQSPAARSLQASRPASRPPSKPPSKPPTAPPSKPASAQQSRASSKPPSKPPSGPPSKPASKPASRPSTPTSRPDSACIIDPIEEPSSPKSDTACPIEPSGKQTPASRPQTPTEKCVKIEPDDSCPISTTASRPITPQKKSVPPSPERPRTPDVCKTPEKGEKLDECPEKVERILSPAKTDECVIIPKVDKQEKAERILSKPEMPQCEPDKVDRLLSKSKTPSRPATPPADVCLAPEASPQRVPSPKSKEACVPSPKASRAPSPKAREVTMSAQKQPEVCPPSSYYDPRGYSAQPHPAYVPAQEANMARVVRAMSDTYSCQDPMMDRRLPPGGQSYHPGMHVMDGSTPCFIEQIPQEILVPSQATKGYSSQHQYQSIQSGQQHHLDMTAQGKDPIREQGMSPTRDCDRDQANIWTLYRLTDLSQQQKGCCPCPSSASGMYMQGPGEYHHQQQQQQQQQQQWMHDQQCVQQMMSPMHYQNYPPTNSQVVNSPAYMVSDESKRRTPGPPFILVGSNVQEAHDWKAIPGHSVVSNNDLQNQRRYTTVPVPVAMTPDSRMVTPNAQSPGQDMNAPGNPVYYSVGVPLDESKRMAASRSFTHHVGTDQRAPVPPNCTPQGPSVAVTAAASRRPSVSAETEQQNATNARPAETQPQQPQQPPPPSPQQQPAPQPPHSPQQPQPPQSPQPQA